MGKKYSTKVFLPLPKKIETSVIPVVENISLDKTQEQIKKKLPEKEIIKPQKPVIREVISPENN